jgi:hypothetical protein
MRWYGWVAVVVSYALAVALLVATVHVLRPHKASSPPEPGSLVTKVP